LAVHSARVLEMFKWLKPGKGGSWTTIKKTLEKWVQQESDADDGENYAALSLDIVNLMLYCGGIRTFKVNDTEELEVDSLSDDDKKALIRKLERSAQAEHDDIEPVPDGAASDDDDDDGDDAARNEEDEKAEEVNGRRKAKKKGPRTTAERVLDFEPMLWRNDTAAKQRQFLNRYRNLLLRFVEVLEDAIYRSDDYIVTILLNWCQFLSRHSHLTQLRRVGTFTAFTVCEPMVKCMATNRQRMATIQKRLGNLEKKEAAKRHKHKANGKRAESAQLRACKQNIEEFQAKIDNLEVHTKWVFDEIGAYKASDHSEEIRVMVLDHIVKCINIDPSTDSFLSAHYWQYLAYGLQDKQSALVRRTALLRLQDLFDYQCKFHGKKKAVRASPKKKKVLRDDDGNVIEERDEDKLDETRARILDPFWERIRPAINVLLRDRDEAVVTHCVEFVNILLRGDLLGAEDGDCILNYIFDQSDAIRQVAASFIFHDTFAEQAVLKSHESSKHSKAHSEAPGDGEEEEEGREARLRIVDATKMKDDVVELIQLMKDRVVDLNLQTNALLTAVAQRADRESSPEAAGSGREFRRNALYRNYVQVSDYIVQSMSKELPVLREWSILFEILRAADDEEQRQKERNLTDRKRRDDAIEEMQAKYSIDDEGQTMLCHLVLSCTKAVVGRLDGVVLNVKAKRGRKSKIAEQEEREQALRRLKECVVPHLSALLGVYQADVFKLFPLIQIVGVLPIDTFDGLRQKEHVLQILNSLKTIFLRHDTPYTARPPLADGDGDGDSDSTGDVPLITDEMDDSERDEVEQRMRRRQMAQLRDCVKADIDRQLVSETGRAFSCFCSGHFQYRETAGRFVFEIVTEITDEFEDIAQRIEDRLRRGHRMDSLRALCTADGGGGGDGASKHHLVQSLLSNLERQHALKRGMDVGPIEYGEAMESLATHIVDGQLFDGAHCEISSVLLRILVIEINRNVANKLNAASPEMERLHQITQQKQSLVKLLRYFVDRIDRHIAALRQQPEGEDSLSPSPALSLLDLICSAIECLTFFRRMRHQSPLMDECFNNASLSEMEPVYGVENSGVRGQQGPMSLVKEQLLRCFQYVMAMPVAEDPFDLSAHRHTENVQIRYLMAFARLLLMNPSYYKRFGGAIVAALYRPAVGPDGLALGDGAKAVTTRRHQTMKEVLRKLHSDDAAKFNRVLFEGVRMLMDDETLPLPLRVHTVQSATKSAAMIDGLAKDRKHWALYIELFLSHCIGSPQNVPRCFAFLHSMTSFFKKFRNRDKLEVWSLFRRLSRKLPPSELRTDDAAWALYEKFRAKLKSEAMKASEARELGLDEDGLENWDQREAAADGRTAPSADDSRMVHDIHIGDGDGDGAERDGGGGRAAGDDDEVPRIAVSVSRLNVSGSERAEESNANVRVAVAASKRMQHDDDSDGNKENRRVAVAVSKRAGDGGKDERDDDDEDEDDDVDMDKGSESASPTKKKTPSAKWMKRKNNK